ncbi:MAG TPA: hypothetical protein VFU10_06695 [Gaiellaceae bacterium]|nr:hypothetical protein [Gaiellaceae bacterium]
MLAPAPEVPLGERATRRLLADCLTLSWLLDQPQVTARERLERAVGDRLARRLVGALAGDHRMRADERIA